MRMGAMVAAGRALVLMRVASMARSVMVVVMPMLVLTLFAAAMVMMAMAMVVVMVGVPLLNLHNLARRSSAGLSTNSPEDSKSSNDGVDEHYLLLICAR